MCECVLLWYRGLFVYIKPVSHEVCNDIIEYYILVTVLQLAGLCITHRCAL